MTIAGLHTAHELGDLLAAKQVNANDLAAAVTAATAAGVNESDPTWAAWLNDWRTFLNAFATQSAFVNALVQSDKASLLGWDYTTEEIAYNAFLTSWAPFEGLVTRWAQLPNNPQANYASHAVPQPTAPDADLGALNTINTIPVVKAGGLIDQAVAAVESPGSSVPWLLYGGIVAGTLLGVVLLKRLL